MARSFNDVSGPSIFTHWLETAPNPGRNLPSGHLRRRQNKYLQLSSTLFGDEGVRDNIREKRDFENQERLQRQIIDYEIEKQKAKLEDERVYNAMGIGGPRKDIDYSKSVESYGSHNLGGQTQRIEQPNQEFQQGFIPQQQYINYDQQLHQYQQQVPNYGQQDLQPNLNYRPQAAELHSINYGPPATLVYGQQPPLVNYGSPVVIPQGHQPTIFNNGPPIPQHGQQSHPSNYGPSLVLPQGHRQFRSAPPSGYRPKSQAPEPKTSQHNSQKQRGISKSAYEPSFHDKSNQGRPNYHQYKGSQLQRRHSIDYAPTENGRKQINPDYQLFADTPPRRRNQALSADDFYQQTAREAEEDRAAILQQQIEEKRYLEDERRARDIYHEQFIEQNAIIHREKLMREYEQEQQEKFMKEQLLGQRRDAQLAKLEALNKLVEEEKKNKYSIVQQNRAKKAAVTISPIPAVRIESAHDATPVGGKRSKETKANTTKKGSKHVGKEGVKSTKKKVSIEKEPTEPKTSVVDTKGENSKFVPKKLPEMFRDTKDESRRGVNNGRRHEIDSMRFDHASPDHIVSFEKDGKRRRMPSKKTDDFGRTLQGASKMPLVKPDTSNYFIESDDRRRKVRSLRDKRFKKQETIKLGPQTPPLPPIGNQKRVPLGSPTSSMEEMSTQTDDDVDRNYRRPTSLPSHFDRRPSPPPIPFEPDDEPVHEKNEYFPEISPPTTPPVIVDPPKHQRPKIATPPPFDWGVEMKGADDEEVAQLKKTAKKDTEDFAKKNEGIFSQLKALKRRLKNSGKDKADDDDDEDSQRKDSVGASHPHEKADRASNEDERKHEPKENKSKHSKEKQKEDSNKNSPENSAQNADIKINSPDAPMEREKEKHNQKKKNEENEPKEKLEHHQAKKSITDNPNEQTLSPEDFKRKISLNTGANIDLEASNRTVLKNFLQKFSKRNKDYDDD